MHPLIGGGGRPHQPPHLRETLSHHRIDNRNTLLEKGKHGFFELHVLRSIVIWPTKSWIPEETVCHYGRVLQRTTTAWDLLRACEYNLRCCTP